MQSSITIVEGATFAQLKDMLRSNPGVRNTVLDLPDAELLARIGVTGEHAEGLFFTDTYFFARHFADAALLKRAWRMLDARLQSGWATGPRSLAVLWVDRRLDRTDLRFHQ